jgi:hypothetical protein
MMKTIKIVVAFSAFLALQVFSTAQAATLDQNFVTTGNPNNNTGLGLVNTGLAQSFTVGISGILNSVSFNILKLNGTTGDLTIDIRNMTAGAPDLSSVSALASTTVSNSDIDTFGVIPYAYSNILADFSSANISVSSGDILAFVLSSPIGEDFGVQTDYLDGYAAGSRFSQNGDGTAWANLASADLTFSTYVDVNISPVPVPAAFWLFGTALIGFVGMSRRRKVS